jgi:hypothetical protein
MFGQSAAVTLSALDAISHASVISNFVNKPLNYLISRALSVSSGPNITLADVGAISLQSLLRSFPRRDRRGWSVQMDSLSMAVALFQTL